MTARADNVLSFGADTSAMAPWLEVPCDWRRPGSAGHTVFWDAAAQYGQVLPRPAADDIAAFYDVAYYTHTDDAAAQDRTPGLVWRVVRRLAWNADHGVEPDDAWWQTILNASPGRVLELGCGDGATLRRLAAMGHEVVGLEPDPKARQACAEQGLTVLDGRSEVVPQALEADSFDCVIMMHSLEHCLDPARALENARSLLRSGGTLVVEVPNNACLGLAHFGKCWLFLDVPRHLQFFTSKSLADAVRAEGFDVKRTDFLGYTMQFAPDWRAQQARICAAFDEPAALNGVRSYLHYLWHSRAAPDDQKYCSVRVTATKKAA